MVILFSKIKFSSILALFMDIKKSTTDLFGSA